ncbi:hypothetical protein TRVL_05249 [Trypanosoma vivax]|nr:hypothetical protein TRVL_05249 [Trypanosoma vivax]
MLHAVSPCLKRTAMLALSDETRGLTRLMFALLLALLSYKAFAVQTFKALSGVASFQFVSFVGHTARHCHICPSPHACLFRSSLAAVGGLPSFAACERMHVFPLESLPEYVANECRNPSTFPAQWCVLTAVVCKCVSTACSALFTVPRIALAHPDIAARFSLSSSLASSHDSVNPVIAPADHPKVSISSCIALDSKLTALSVNSPACTVLCFKFSDTLHTLPFTPVPSATSPSAMASGTPTATAKKTKIASQPFVISSAPPFITTPILSARLSASKNLWPDPSPTDSLQILPRIATYVPM